MEGSRFRSLLLPPDPQDSRVLTDSLSRGTCERRHVGLRLQEIELINGAFFVLQGIGASMNY